MIESLRSATVTNIDALRSEMRTRISALENRINERDKVWDARYNALLAEIRSSRWVFSVAMTLVMLLLALIAAGVLPFFRDEPERPAPPPVAAGQSQDPASELEPGPERSDPDSGP